MAPCYLRERKLLQPGMESDTKRSNEELLDEGVKETFPASDPVSVAQTSKVPTTQPPQPAKRSPDWMFEKKS